MKLTRGQKAQVVEALVQRFGRAQTIYVTDFTGLGVKQLTELRRRLRAVGGEYLVVKNTLARRALAAVDRPGLAEVLAGPSGVVFVSADPVAPAKVLAEFQKEYERPAVKAGVLEGRPLGPEEVKRLASLPPREQLLGQVAGALQAPLVAWAGALNGLLYQVVGALEALRAQREASA